MRTVKNKRLIPLGVDGVKALVRNVNIARAYDLDGAIRVREALDAVDRQQVRGRHDADLNGTVALHGGTCAALQAGDEALSRGSCAELSELLF